MNGGEEEKREREREREREKRKVWKGTKRGEKGKNGLGLVRGATVASHRLSGVGPAQSRPITSMGYLRLTGGVSADWPVVRIGMR